MDSQARRRPPDAGRGRRDHAARALRWWSGKLLFFLVSVLALSFLVFYISRLAPGDPLVSYYGGRVEKMGPQERAWAEHKLGLDRPIYVQYGKWIAGALHGDLGISYKYKTGVVEVIAGRITGTLLLGGTGFVLIFCFSLLLGVFSAWSEDRWPDRIICRLGTLFCCIPEFWMSLMMILIFSVYLRILPSSGAYTTGHADDSGDRALHLVLPLTVVVMGHLWYYAYMVRNMILDETREEYVRLAKAKGLGKGQILFGHCLHNILPSYLSVMAVSVPHILSGTYIVETVFSYPGLGTLSYESARYKDYDLLMLLSILSGAVVILCSIVAQAVNERIDPRFRPVRGEHAEEEQTRRTRGIPAEADEGRDGPDAAAVPAAERGEMASASAALPAMCAGRGEIPARGRSGIFGGAREQTARDMALRDTEVRDTPECDPAAGGAAHVPPAAGGGSDGVSPAAGGGSGGVSPAADPRFVRTGPQPAAPGPAVKRPSWYRSIPFPAAALFAVIAAGCILSSLFLKGDPSHMDLAHFRTAPCREFPFGTDTMGRDIFSMIWHGGRVSLTIGFSAAAISAVIAVFYGTVSGMAPRWLDQFMMRAVEILLSVPELLLIMLLSAAWGGASVLSLSVIIGVTSWMSMAKVVRAEVRKIRNCEYVLASRMLGAGYFRILRRDLAPNCISSILFMVVMNVRSAIMAESTLSFMGLGLPLEVISWGSMLSLAEQALLSGEWWIILVPGAFLAVTLLCVTEIANGLRRQADQRVSNL